MVFVFIFLSFGRENLLFFARGYLCTLKIDATNQTFIHLFSNHFVVFVITYSSLQMRPCKGCLHSDTKHIDTTTCITAHITTVVPLITAFQFTGALSSLIICRARCKSKQRYYAFVVGKVTDMSLHKRKIMRFPQKELLRYIVSSTTIFS